MNVSVTKYQKTIAPTPKDIRVVVCNFRSALALADLVPLTPNEIVARPLQSTIYPSSVAMGCPRNYREKVMYISFFPNQQSKVSEKL
jgi:hypothetical protein